MSNVSTRFTFRDGKTYLTGYPEWPGVHNLNEPIYQQYDTLYIGPKIPGQEVYYIIGPEYTTGEAPKLGVTHHDDDYQLEGGSVLTPGLHVFVPNADDEGYHELQQDPANIIPTLVPYSPNVRVARDAQLCRIVPVVNNQNVYFQFGDMGYNAGNNFIPKQEPAFAVPFPSTLILPVGNFAAQVGAKTNGYAIKPETIAPTAFVYAPDGKRLTGSFSYYSTMPIVVESGPRIHYQASGLGLGQHWYDTCYYIQEVSLTNLARQPGDPT